MRGFGGRGRRRRRRAGRFFPAAAAVEPAVGARAARLFFPHPRRVFPLSAFRRGQRATPPTISLATRSAPTLPAGRANGPQFRLTRFRSHFFGAATYCRAVRRWGAAARLSPLCGEGARCQLARRRWDGEMLANFSLDSARN